MSRANSVKDQGNTDLPLKDLLRDGRSKLIELLAGTAVVRTLFTEFPRFNLRKSDLLFELENGTLFHPEIQSRNEKKMPVRMGEYGLLIDDAYSLPLSQCILYIGQKAMRMPGTYIIARHVFSCPIVDIRDFNADILLSSGFPSDIVLAMLASGGEKRIVEILERLAVYDTRQRRRAVAFLLSLSTLRHGTSTILKKDQQRMPVYLADLNLEENYLFQQGEERGLKLGLQRGGQEATNQNRDQIANALTEALKKRFQRIPAKYAKRIQSANLDQLSSWFINATTANDLTEVFR
jgi:hypothetical protein